MFARVLIYLLMIPVVFTGMSLARAEVTGKTYCLNDFLAASSAQYRSQYCMTVPTQMPTSAIDKPDWSGLFSTLGG